MSRILGGGGDCTSTVPSLSIQYHVQYILYTYLSWPYLFSSLKAKFHRDSCKQRWPWHNLCLIYFLFTYYNVVSLQSENPFLKRGDLSVLCPSNMALWVHAALWSTLWLCRSVLVQCMVRVCLLHFEWISSMHFCTVTMILCPHLLPIYL